MKKMMILMIGISAVLSSCNTKNASKSDKDSTAVAGAVVGNDVDEHGCKASTGYTWSEALKDCIRVWEKGVKMESTEQPDATIATFIVFSSDSSKVELFIPGKTAHALLDRMKPVSGPLQEVWSSDTASNGLKVYRNKDKLFVIEQEGKVQYREVPVK